MELIAKTEKGYLISATELEVNSIFSATGRPIKKSDEVKIGDKLPAFDYASVIQKCKEFKNTYSFKEFKSYHRRAFEEYSELINSIDSLSFDE